MDQQENENNQGASPVGTAGKRKYVKLNEDSGDGVKIPSRTAERKYLQPVASQEKKNAVDTQKIDISKLRKKAVEEKPEPAPVQIVTADRGPSRKPSAEVAKGENSGTKGSLSQSGVIAIGTMPRSENLPELTTQAITEIQAAIKKGHYEILEPIAKGAESVLYKAQAAGHIFCVKAIRNRLNGVLGSSNTRNNQEKLQDVSYGTKCRHLRNEYDVARAIYNPNEEMPVIRIFGLEKVSRFGLELGYDLMMEMIQGHDLSDRALIRKFGFEDKVRLMYQATSALHYLHKKKMIHLDIKPSNFMLTRWGKVRLIDFGISVWCGYKGRSITGTAGYLSPEQIAKEQLNEATDIFALGVTFAILFGGKPLAQNQEDLVLRTVRQEAKFHLESGDVTAISDIPELLDKPLIGDIIRNCSIMKRESRIQNCQTLLLQLEQAAKTYGFSLA